MSQREAVGESGARPRRSFLKAAAWALGSLVAAVLATPLVGSMLGGLYRRSRTYMTKAAAVDGLPLGKPVLVTFGYKSEDAYIAEAEFHDVFVVRHSDSEVTVFSPICTHLGCHFEWDAAGRRFVCPCHGSVFSITGQVLGGPAPRPLDTLPHEIRDGVLYVEWERFEPGIAGKVRV